MTSSSSGLHLSTSYFTASSSWPSPPAPELIQCTAWASTRTKRKRTGKGFLSRAWHKELPTTICIWQNRDKPRRPRALASPAQRTSGLTCSRVPPQKQDPLCDWFCGLLTSALQSEIHFFFFGFFSLLLNCKLAGKRRQEIKKSTIIHNVLVIWGWLQLRVLFGLEGCC